jgi:hypothetical protein
MERTSGAGFPVPADSQLTDSEANKTLGEPGKYLFSNGVYPRGAADRSRIRHNHGRALSPAEARDQTYGPNTSLNE